MAGKNRRPKVYHVEVEVSYIPFPDEETRLEAYRTHARLFLKVKERGLKERKKQEAKQRNGERFNR